MIPKCPVLEVAAVPVTFKFVTSLQHHFARSHWRVKWLANYPGPQLASDQIAWSVQRTFSPVRDIVALFELLFYIHRERPLVVHVHTPKAGLLAAVGANLTGTYCVFSLHGLLSDSKIRNVRIAGRAAEFVTLYLVNEVWPVAEWMIARIRADADGNSRKVFTPVALSAGGIDERRFDPDVVRSRSRTQTRSCWRFAEDTVVIGVIGRLGVEKGLDELLAVWERLQSRLSNIALVIVGEFDARFESVSSAAMKLKCDPAVRIVPWVENIEDAYAAMDLLFHPTHREGLPYVLLEAAAMGLPIVTTRIPGCLEVLDHGSFGTAVEIGDVGAMVEAISRYCSDVELRVREGLRSRENVVRRFNSGQVGRLQFERMTAVVAQACGAVV